MTFSRYFRWQNAAPNITILASLNVVEQSFTSLSIHEKELWLLTADGSKAWRRLSISHQNPIGERWMALTLHLPLPATMLSIGAAGIFALMQGGAVAKFQGMILSLAKSHEISIVIDAKNQL